MVRDMAYVPGSDGWLYLACSATRRDGDVARVVKLAGPNILVEGGVCPKAVHSINGLKVFCCGRGLG